VTWREYRYLVRSDLHRQCGRATGKNFLLTYFRVPGFKYAFWLRTAAYLKTTPLRLLYYAARLHLRQQQHRFGIDIPYNTTIGPGLYIGHYGGIVVNHQAVLGRNCNLNHGVTIGVTYGGKTPGVPRIGDNVYIGPGSFVIGGIEVGNNVAIGANTVLTRSVPDDAVVASAPGEVISDKGSYAYVVNTDY
jgi:serine O-acetyltransferase